MTRRSLTRPMPALEAEPDLTKEQKEAIIAALQWGWNEVWSRWPEVIVSGREEKITARLCEVLCEQHPDGRRAAPGLSLFETVNRGGKTRGADDRVEYQPDLVFRPLAAPAVRNLNRWGWFVECKLVDGASRHDRSKTRPPCVRIALWHLWLSARHGQRSGGHQLLLGL